MAAEVLMKLDTMTALRGAILAIAVVVAAVCSTPR